MSRRFAIEYRVSATLSVEDLWPDGDAPEDPTASDVLALIEACGGVEVLRDWNLEEHGSLGVREVKT